MSSIEILIVLSAFAIVLSLWVAVGITHLKTLKKGVNEQWDSLDEVMRKRYDLIPNLIETVRSFENSKEELLQNLIFTRAQCVKIVVPGNENIKTEHQFNKLLDQVFDLSETNRSLGTDTNFLELRKEIKDLQITINDKSATYNEVVKYFNDHRNFAYLKPLAAILDYNPIDIFDVNY